MLTFQEGNSSGLIATPEVTSEAIQEDLEFVILATDGLWDVIDDQVRGPTWQIIVMSIK